MSYSLTSASRLSQSARSGSTMMSLAPVRRANSRSLRLVPFMPNVLGPIYTYVGARACAGSAKWCVGVQVLAGKLQILDVFSRRTRRPVRRSCGAGSKSAGPSSGRYPAWVARLGGVVRAASPDTAPEGARASTSSARGTQGWRGRGQQMKSGAESDDHRDETDAAGMHRIQRVLGKAKAM